MFETVVPETVGKRSKKVFYETLPVSLAGHVVAVAGVLLSTVWQVGFPDHSPHLSMAYSLTSVPEPPPPPPPPQVMDTAPKPEPKNIAPPPPALLEMAPRVIPTLVPHVEIPPPVPPPPPPKVAVADAVPGGDPNGEKGGKLGGEIGGHGKGLAFSVVFPDDGRLYIERDAKLPLILVNPQN